MYSLVGTLRAEHTLGDEGLRTLLESSDETLAEELYRNALK